VLTSRSRSCRSPNREGPPSETDAAALQKKESRRSTGLADAGPRRSDPDPDASRSFDSSPPVRLDGNAGPLAPARWPSGAARVAGSGSRFSSLSDVRVR
jgi:hypothetical protein